MPGPSTRYDTSQTLSEYPVVPIAGQPFADIDTHYNKLVRAIEEIWACINGENAGVDVNGAALKDYSSSALLGLLPRLLDIEDSGKISDSAIIQLGAALAAGDRSLRFLLGSSALYKELQYSNSAGIFRFADQSGALQRVQASTPVSAADLATKQYVDGIIASGALKKHAEIAAPVRASNTTFTIAYGFCADSTGSLIMAKDTSSTVSVATVGFNGIASSSASTAVSGTISVSSSSSSVTGVGTTFTTDFIAGDYIKTAGGQTRLVSSVTNNTSLTVSSNFSSNESGVSYSRGGSLTASMMDLNLYMISDAVGGNVGFLLSNRNTLGGEALVDLPSIQKSGSASVTSGSNTINGSGTSFLTDFTVGQKVVVSGSGFTVFGTVATISSNTSMTVSGTWGTSITNGAIYVATERYRQLPFAAPIDGSGNLLDWLCEGFPWNTYVNLIGYDGTGRYGLFSAITTTTATSKNLQSTGFVPKLCRRVRIKTFINIINQATAPNYFHIGPSSSLVAMYSAFPFSYLYNSGSNWGTATVNHIVDIPLDSSQQIWYRALATAGASGGADILGFYMTEWRG